MFRFRSFSPIASALAIFLAACSPPPVAKPPYIDLATNQPASVVIGQPDFTSTSETDMTRSFTSTYGRPLLLNDVLYLPDYGAGRVMGYLGVPTANDAAADFVLGRDGFDDFAPGPASARRLGGPQSLATDGKILIVADADNNRVLIWNTFPTSNFAQADVVLGQAGFGTNAPGVGASKLDYPQSLHSNGTQLFVADGDNNRVLIWDAIPTANGQPADKVLGQADMDSALTDGGSVTPTAMGLAYPSGVYAFGNNLLVSDNDNARYLIFEGAVAP